MQTDYYNSEQGRLRLPLTQNQKAVLHRLSLLTQTGSASDRELGEEVGKKRLAPALRCEKAVQYKVGDPARRWGSLIGLSLRERRLVKELLYDRIDGRHWVLTEFGWEVCKHFGYFKNDLQTV
jgi:hypothetical protein